MYCNFLTRKDGKSYRDCLKDLWDTWNPNKAHISINLLCFHARNIQTANTLMDIDIKIHQAQEQPNYASSLNNEQNIEYSQQEIPPQNSFLSSNMIVSYQATQTVVMPQTAFQIYLSKILVIQKYQRLDI